ncbi:MAG: alpha/beta hydrolase [Vicinamibacterales bacterium]
MTVASTREPIHVSVSAAGFRAIGCCILSAWLLAADAGAQTPARLALRGKDQALQLYGPRNGDPVIVSSGDGGWIHLGPQVAVMLAARGFFVVGFDSKAYLEAFTTGSSTLTTKEVPSDYRELIKFASSHSAKKPILIGVSEGAALSLLAATQPATRELIDGVIGLGLGDRNELGWRWRDALIYVTHGVPNEPTFSTREMAASLSPTPLAVINSSHDEFVTSAEVSAILGTAKEPKRLWMIDAADHRFSNRPAELTSRLLEAIDWIRQNAAGR